MDTDQLKELAPHYIAMFIVAFGIITIIRVTVGSLGFWIELVIIAAIAFAYRPIVMGLGIGSSGWEQ